MEESRRVFSKRKVTFFQKQFESKCQLNHPPKVVAAIKQDWTVISVKLKLKPFKKIDSKKNYKDYQTFEKYNCRLNCGNQKLEKSVSFLSGKA